MQSYDVAILGAGPAGLAAAQKLSNQGLKVILIEKGEKISLRKKELEAELTQGHGGAGLYSDGKFSFFPSATHLWSLSNRQALHEAYAWTCNLLNSYGLDTPPFPETPNAYIPGTGNWIIKSYPSDYLSLSSRIKMISRLVDSLNIELANQTQVITHRYDENKLKHFLWLKHNDKKFKISSSTLIIATGRFGAFDIKDNIKFTFRRLEVGFRIEQPHEQAFFQDISNLDPKLTLRSNSDLIEWRTFCACRNGRTVFTRTQGLWTVSGHSDGHPSERSNVGFNTRILDEKMAKRALKTIKTSLPQESSYYSIPLQAWLDGQKFATEKMNYIYGAEVSNFMHEGLKKLIKNFPHLKHDETSLIGPTLEGIGWYPEVDGELKIPEQPTWVVGDACGLFRGIVAALISGYYSAYSISKALEKSYQ